MTTHPDLTTYRRALASTLAQAMADLHPDDPPSFDHHRLVTAESIERVIAQRSVAS